MRHYPHTKWGNLLILNTTNRLNLVQLNLNVIIWYVGLTTYPVTISSEPEGTINTNHGVVKIYTDDPYRSPDFVDKDQFPQIEL